MGTTVQMVSSPMEALYLVEDDLREVCRHTEIMSMDEVCSAVLSGRCQLWIIRGDGEIAGCAVTEIMPGRMQIAAMRVRPSHARDGTFRAALRYFAAVADRLEVELTAISMRPGMGRHLGRLGWQPRMVEYVAPAQGGA